MSFKTKNQKDIILTMRHYENLIIIKPTFTAEEIQSKIKSIEKLITTNGGEIAAIAPLGMRKLAFSIEKNERGYYHVVYYTMAPSSIKEIERLYRLDEDLLRFITIKYDSNREKNAWNKMVDKANKAEEVKTEEVKTEEVKTEEVKAEEVKTEEVKAEEVKAEEVKAEEVKAEEVKTEKVKTKEVKAKEVETKKTPKKESAAKVKASISQE